MTRLDERRGVSRVGTTIESPLLLYCGTARSLVVHPISRIRWNRNQNGKIRSQPANSNREKKNTYCASHQFILFIDWQHSLRSCVRFSPRLITLVHHGQSIQQDGASTPRSASDATAECVHRSLWKPLAAREASGQEEGQPTI